MDYVTAPKPAFTVVSADFVSTDEGTGIVHISKTFGSDDFAISIQNKLPGIFVDGENGKKVPFSLKYNLLLLTFPKLKNIRKTYLCNGFFIPFKYKLVHFE